jgi:hypothetical protein
LEAMAIMEMIGKVAVKAQEAAVEAVEGHQVF